MWHLSISMIDEIEKVCGNSHYLPGLVAESSAVSSLDSNALERLRSTRIAEKSCFDGKKKASYRRSLSGVTYEPSTASRGVEKWTLSLVDSPASRSALPVNALARQTSVTCGPTPSASFAKWHRGSACWRTYQLSLLTGTSVPFSGSFPKAGTASDGKLYRLPSLGRRIGEIASGLLPTPRTCSGKRSSGMNRTEMYRAMWPTPNVPNGGRVIPADAEWHGIAAYRKDKKMQVGLESAVRRWPTPTSRDSRSLKGAEHMKSWTGSPGLGEAVRKNTLTTPTASNKKRSVSFRKGRKPSPQEVAGGALNPPWVAWLMGWPIGWTDLEPLATDRCPSAPQSPFDYWLEIIMEMLDAFK